MKTLKTVLLSLGSGVFGAFLFQHLGTSSTPVLPENTNSVMRTVSQAYTNSPINADFVAASAASTSSVVFIKTTSTIANQYDMFDWFFGGGGREQKVSGSGSGVIFTADGYVVTNNHVIENASSIEVVHNKRSYKAKMIGTDPSTDIAVLKIEGKGLPAIKLAHSRDVQVGEWVLAVGNPFNLTSTVTAGIVSAKGRNIGILGSQFPIESFIQTDAAINPGNSGGALVNIKGELIGINSAILSRTGSYTGYGFAVPVDIVNKIFNDLVKYGEVQTGFLGAEVSDINSQTAEKYALNDYSGAVVTYLETGSAAEKLGLRKGDVILKVNGQTINSKAEFDEQLSFYRPGDKITVTYRRGNDTKEGQLTLTNREGTTGLLKHETYKAESLGAELEALSKVEKDKFRLQNGVRIVKITGRGVLSQFDEGFIITSINRQPVNAPKDVVDMMGNVRGRLIIEGLDPSGERVTYQMYY
ncbi:trypsin-like peptidase domain-containing protein [Cytophagaceae bacterium DM2B3-1]|uniref:Trypsin-like peptidase domain-containing protein n=1 Tax=Xanthocytophaga flava TaxID=3048013 RepID=A0ABT7CNT3_9BACT|nr:trypsin-like peptidase domain-containing protein [Xanthocytophaga flavus]MDJ1495342.1 trypsin-like peptidase domain-containing protein [Xanthocytophaga flavus]